MISPEFAVEDYGKRILAITGTITGVSFVVVFFEDMRAVMLKKVGSNDYTVSESLSCYERVLIHSIDDGCYGKSQSQYFLNFLLIFESFLRLEFLSAL
jgi:hypothetical protein